jgi:uncharacterized protein involved in exopolysaccharide biosynthesis
MTGPPAAQTFAPFRLLVPLVVRWRLLVLATFLGGVLGVATAFLLPKRYTAVARFTAQSRDGAGIGSSLAALADQFGLDVAIPTGGGMSPAFYADLIATRAILEPVVTARYATAGGDSIDFPAFIRATRGTPRRQVEIGIKKLMARMVTGVHKSGLVSITVSLNDPVVSAGVANRILDELNAFTISRLQFQSRQQRMFAEERLDTALAELRAAEDAEAAFVERNRSYQQSPTLQAQLARLQRVTMTKQEVVSTLSRGYEEARVQEVRDMPALTIVEVAVPPAKKSWPRRSIAGIGGALGAFAILVVLLWVRDWLAEARRERRADVLELVDAWKRTGRARQG